MIPSDGLERLLKGLEGHVVDSVEISREDGFLHVKMSVIGLDERHPLNETLGSAALGSTDVSFSVMWKKTVDRMLDDANKKVDEILSTIEAINSNLNKTLGALRDR